MPTELNINIHFNINKYQHSLTAWQLMFGRNNLPWQKSLEPYLVWVSEIMLQQTQVKTVIPYYQKFITRFPSIEILAAASNQEVMTYWAGLGYYARCRNLHQSAKIILMDYDGKFPDIFEKIIKLPGIGRSTANAILSICYKQSTPILDGNVKRIFSRLFQISEPTTTKKVEQKLWEASEELMPTLSTGEYTQALMDLGSLICTRKEPDCNNCPISQCCLAREFNKVDNYPAPKPKKLKPIKMTTFYIYRYKNKILLKENPPKGIWGGLFVLPEEILDIEISSGKKLLPKNQKHVFTHYILKYSVELFECEIQKEFTDTKLDWVIFNEIEKFPLPTPIKNILNSFDLLAM